MQKNKTPDKESEVSGCENEVHTDDTVVYIGSPGSQPHSFVHMRLHHHNKNTEQ